MLSLIRVLQVNGHLRLAVSTRETPFLTLPTGHASGTLDRSIPRVSRETFDLLSEAIVQPKPLTPTYSATASCLDFGCIYIHAFA